MPAVLIIVPCFNEAARLDTRAFADFAETETNFTFCFVDDGSTDRTDAVLAALNTQNPAHLTFRVLQSNCGKAEAVRQGVLAGLNEPGYDYFGFLDADLAAPLSQLKLLAGALQPGVVRMAIGSRVKRLGATIDRRSARHYIGRIFATLVSKIFAIDVYDSQCGIKIMDREFARVAFAEPFHSPWIFDVEILSRLRGLTNDFTTSIVEVPLEVWTEKAGSKISMRSMLRVPGDLFRIRLLDRRQ